MRRSELPGDFWRLPAASHFVLTCLFFMQWKHSLSRILSLWNVVCCSDFTALIHVLYLECCMFLHMFVTHKYFYIWVVRITGGFLLFLSQFLGFACIMLPLRCLFCYAVFVHSTGLH